MPITLTRFADEPHFDRLPVQILRCALTVPPNDRVYAQGQLCRTDDAVYARVWTFESAPAPDTRLEAVFYGAGHTLAAAATIGGDASLTLDGAPIEGRLTAYLFSGEDLQGVYAGAVLVIDADTFFGAFGQRPDDPDVAVAVNLLRRGAYVSSLAPEGESVPLNV